MKNIIRGKNNRIIINSHIPINFFLLFICLCGCTVQVPYDFNFVAIFGIMEENEVNTFKNTYKRTYDWDKDTIVPFVLSEKQKKLIYKMIKCYSIEEIPNVFEPKSNKTISPSPTYYLKYKMHELDKEIIWETNVNSKERHAKQLRSIFFEIENFVNENKLLIQKLPKDIRGKL